jgi:hypothetical protein
MPATVVSCHHAPQEDAHLEEGVSTTGGLPVGVSTAKGIAMSASAAGGQMVGDLVAGGIAVVGVSAETEKKMTQGWVVYGGMRHAEPQREMFSRSYCRDRLSGTGRFSSWRLIIGCLSMHDEA